MSDKSQLHSSTMIRNNQGPVIPGHNLIFKFTERESGISIKIMSQTLGKLRGDHYPQ